MMNKFEERKAQIRETYDREVAHLGRIGIAAAGEQPKEMACQQHGPYLTRIVPAPGASSLRRMLDPSAVVSMMAYETCPNCTDTIRTMRDEALAQVDRDEVSEREECRLRHIIDSAGVSPRHAGYSLEGIRAVNSDQQRAVDALKEVVEKVLSCAVAPNIILLGGVGTGKSLVAAAAIQSLIRAGGRGVFTTMKDIVRDYRATWARGSEVTEADFVRGMSNTPILVIDEVGLLAGTDNEMAIIFDILDGRYRNMKPTILISNLDIAGVKAAIGDRCVDRMREDGGKMIAFDYESQRGKAR